MVRENTWVIEVKMLRSWYEGKASGRSPPLGFGHWAAFEEAYGRLRRSETAGRIQGEGNPISAIEERVSRLGPKAMVTADDWESRQRRP